jgi:chaperonin GroES
MNYRPLYDNIVVKLMKAQEKTESGIILPGASKEKPHQGEVVSVGEGKLLDNGQVRPLAVKVGQKVIFKSYAPSELPNEEELVVISESDVLAVIE